MTIETTEGAAGAGSAQGGEGASGAGAAQGGEGAAGGGAATWRDGLPEPLRADATLGKYDTLEAFATSHLDLKRQFGADKIVVPKGDDDAEGWSNAFNALGRPEKPEDYKFPTVKEGEPDSPLAAALRPKLFEAGLNQRQVALLDTALGDVVKGALDADFATGAAEIDALKKEIGDTAFDDMSKRARAAATAFGVSAEASDKLDRIVGSAELVRLFDQIGQRMGEGRFIPGDLPEGFTIAADPQKQLDELQGSKEWREKLDNGDPNVLRQRKALIAAIAAQKGA